MIKNIGKITGVLNTWKPSDVAFIKSLKWSLDDLTIIAYCQSRGGVNGWPDLTKEFYEVSLIFINVSNLRLEFVFKGLQQVSGFDIVDVSNNGLEKINFQIEDYESGVINFNCEHVEVLEVSKLTKIVLED